MKFEMPVGAIAIVGMSGRFPGAPNLERFWENLREGIRGIAAVAEEHRPKYAQLPNYVPAAGVLTDADLFDAAFFEISRREAEILDPQRRVFLECAWEALENAGLDPFVYDGSIGVYAGASASSYLPPRFELDKFTRDFDFLISNDKDYLASYVGYKLNLRGPCVAIQTACSTSLVAVHIACASLLAHECDVALSGGVTVRFPQGLGYLYEEGHIFSPDGHCRAFDTNANGTVFTNGVGVVVLKRLEDAIADGDRIRAIIRGSAINNDGSMKVGFTAPSVLGQMQVITEALAIADVDASTIQYIEAHGTATSLGDAIEIAALKQAFGAESIQKRSIALGALKASVGHTESATGVGGLIKTVLAMENHQIPAHPGFEKPNPELGLDESPFYVNPDAHEWLAKENPRRAGVSSFGIGGTNAHVIVEEAPPREWTDPALEGMPLMLPLSARSPAALLEMAQSYGSFFGETETNLRDIVFTASVRRRHHEHRLAVVGTNKKEMAAALGAFAMGEVPPGVATGKTAQSTPKVVFVFPGQGSQWVGMGRQLYREEPAFRDALVACDVAIRKEAGVSVVEELDKPEETSRLSDIDVVQPVLFAIEVALAALWRSWGVEPAAVVGHSMGEVAAAFVAGALSMADAAAIICRRSRLLRTLSGKGAMALVELAMPDAEKALLGYEIQLSVAVSNGPRSTVIAGDPSAIEEVLGKLEKDGVFCQRIKADVASHSPQMDPLLGDVIAALSDISPNELRIPMRSTVTGELVSGAELVGKYWADNLRRPVLFSNVIDQWIADGFTIFLEMSPHPVILPFVDENLSDKKANGAVLASLRYGRDERQSMLSSLGALFVRGVPVDWKAFFPDGGRVVELPSYPWQRERYWIEPSTGSASTTKSFIASHSADSNHPLVGVSFTSSLNPESRFWQQSLSVAAIPWLAEHRVQGEIVFPGAGYVECALEAGAETLGAGHVLLEDIAFERMMVFDEDQAREVEVVFIDDGSRKSFRISSQSENSPWMRHASGYIQSLENVAADKAELPNTIAGRLPQVIDVAGFYEGIRARQAYHGPPFQGIVELRAGEHEALAKIRLPEDVRDKGYVIHPALLDACLQVSGAMGLTSSDTDTYVPVGIERLHLFQRPSRESWVLATKSAKDATTCDLRVTDENGNVLVAIEGLRSQRIDRVASSTDALEGCVYEVDWTAVDVVPEPKWRTNGTWVVVADRSGTSDALTERLVAHGQRCIRIEFGASYQQIEPNAFHINASNPEDYRRVFTDTFGENGRCEGVVHLASLDVTPFEQTTIESLTADLTHASVSATYLAQATVRHGFRDAPRLFLITRGAQSVHSADPVSVAQSSILGLGKTIAMEQPELRCTRIDLTAEASENDTDLLWRELGSKDREDQIALRGQSRYVARLEQGQFEVQDNDERYQAVEPARGRPYRLEIRNPGVLERLALHEMAMPQPGPGEVLIEVEAAGLNFLDVLTALAALPAEATGTNECGPMLGGECAGRITAVGDGVTDLEPGQEVIALGARAFGTYMVSRSVHVVRKPPKLSWQQAATIPLVFLTAYYALEYVGRLRAGERVLIHAGAGGVGLAAIQWAQHVGAEIFATAGSDEKRKYLRELGVTHVFDSRTLQFVDDVKRITGGDGVDVVLNSLSGEFIPASLSLLRDYGRFLEIGKRDYFENKQIGLRPFLRNLSFSLLDLRGLLLQRPERIAELLREVFALFERGDLRALPVQTFPIAAAAEAFKYMAQAKHIGKIALTVKDADAKIVPLERNRTTSIRADRTYLITGGLGGLGFSLAKWLVEQGARSLVLVGRKGPSNEARLDMATMEQAGARVHCAQVDVSQERDVENLFATIRNEMLPLGGIVHAAMVLDDHTLLEQSEASFQKSFAPKALGAWNLHKYGNGEHLDFFVMYSSGASLMGSPGQANYCASNAFLDALCRERAVRGLPGMSIQWGGFSEVGAAAALDIRGKRISYRGVGSFSPSEGLEAFLRLLAHPRPEVGAMRFDPRQWVEFYPSTAGVPFFAEVMKQDANREKSTSRAKEMRERLQNASLEERLPLLERHLMEQVGVVLHLDATRIDRMAPLQSLGMDSLMSLELRNRLEATLGLRISATALFTYSGIASLAKYLVSQIYVLENEKDASILQQTHRVNAQKDVADVVAMSTQETEAAIEAEIAALEGLAL